MCMVTPLHRCLKAATTHYDQLHLPMPATTFAQMDRTSVSRKLQLPPAIATSWNAKDVYVFCPYCKESHRHGTGSGERWPPGLDIVNSRVPHCGFMPIFDEDGSNTYHFRDDYQILYPFEQNQATQGYGFEFDSRDGMFRTMGLNIPEQDQAVEDATIAEIEEELRLLEGNDPRRPYDLAVVFRDMNLDGHASGHRGVDSKDAAIFDDLLDYCFSGKLPGFINLFQSLPDRMRWLHWTDDTSTLLHYAAIKGHHRVARYLLEQGADANATNARKRTPLMEAALWGRTLTVHLLLEHKADRTMIDIAGYTALEFAKYTTRNTIEQRLRAPLLEINLRECIAGRDDTAVALGHLFVPERTSVSTPISSPSSISAWKSQDPLVLGFNTQVTIAERRASSLDKTLAVLDRGEPYPRVSALSGWEDTSDTNHLNAALWTSEVLDICRMMRFELPEHWYDKGIPGQYKACHAEKQLMAYFLRKHVTESYDYQAVSGERLLDEDSSRKVRAVSSAECKKTPELSIYVTRRPCDNCKSWREVIDQTFGVRFEFHWKTAQVVSPG